MSIEEEFREVVAKRLICLTDDLIPVLKKLIEHKYPAEVRMLAFEIFSEQFTSGFPVRVFFVDENNSEHFIMIEGKAEYPSPVNPDLLKIPYVYPYKLEEEYTDKDDVLDPWDVAANELIEWFSKCWLSAGGMSFALKANIRHHDSNQVYDLKECKSAGL